MERPGRGIKGRHVCFDLLGLFCPSFIRFCVIYLFLFKNSWELTIFNKDFEIRWARFTLVDGRNYALPLVRVGGKNQ